MRDHDCALRPREVFNLAEEDLSDEEQEESALLGAQEQVQEVRRAEDRLQGMSRIQNQVSEVRPRDCRPGQDIRGIVEFASFRASPGTVKGLLQSLLQLR